MYKKMFDTDFGEYYIGNSKNILKSKIGQKIKGNVQLILTSPPFPLNEKKKYGNLQGEEYKKWLVGMSKTFSDLIKEDGSIVMEIGNSWESGKPIQSLLYLETLLEFVKNKKSNLRLCQEFVCYNPSRLPSPAPWVTRKRIRAIDSFTHIWWMAKSDYPKADNTKVLRPYSKSMKNLLKKKKYNSGKRPSGHKIAEKSFFKKNNGSIMPNVLEIEQIDENREWRLPENILSISNSGANEFFARKCRKKGIELHPARMQSELALFFIELLTEPGDIILDPFAGSNTTGFCAEFLGRKWVSVEIKEEYSEQSKIRFEDPILNEKI
nr:site-specific DNA-methyltransferase [Methanobrevibacter arboriphilus]